MLNKTKDTVDVRSPLPAPILTNVSWNVVATSHLHNLRRIAQSSSSTKHKLSEIRHKINDIVSTLNVNISENNIPKLEGWKEIIKK